MTIPEGFTLEQVVKRLVKVGGFSEDKIREAMKDAKGLGLPDVANGNLEGMVGS